MNEARHNRFAGTLGRRISRRVAIGGFAGAGAAAALTTAGLAASPSRPSVSVSQRGALMMQSTPTADGTPTAGGTPTVVFVHGAFADASSWAGVMAELQADGLNVVAPANPLRGVASDAAYIASVVNQIAGPVLLVGHSYGGVVITNAGTQTPNVVGLVYIAAFLPDEGESVMDLAAQATDSLLGPALRPAQFSTGAGTEPGTELYIDTASYHEVFAADVPAEIAAVLAVSQRPGGAAGFGEPSGPPAWKTLPSWALVATADKTIGVSGLRLMAGRAGATTVEIDASHSVAVSQPAAVADVVRTAVAAVS